MEAEYSDSGRGQAEQELERQAVQNILQAFKTFEEEGKLDVLRWEHNFKKLPQEHQLILSHLRSKYDTVKTCLRSNQVFLDQLVATVGDPPPSSPPPPPCDSDASSPEGQGQGQGSSKSIPSTSSSAGSGGSNGKRNRNKNRNKNRKNKGGKGSGSGSSNGSGSGGSGGKACEESRDEDGGEKGEVKTQEGRVSPMDVEKVRYVLKDLVREWSAEGSIERAQSYDKILKLLCDCFPGPIDPRNRPKVLIPGCGLGRLVLEVASRGFQVEGNEFSYYMLFTSAFMMNYATNKNQFQIYPWCLQSCNQRSDRDQCRPVPIPDVCAEDMGILPDQMSICGGDFTHVYGLPEQKGQWDCVITCFFMDTAHNFLHYIEVIRHCLKDGGVWINLGPALWHWADSHTYLGDELSIEVSWEDIDRASKLYGFDIEMTQMAQCNYTNNCRSMMQNVFYCNFSLRRKRGEGGGGGGGGGG